MPEHYCVVLPEKSFAKAPDRELVEYLNLTSISKATFSAQIDELYLLTSKLL